ncbi:MAG TPA: hypothetical protein VLB49_07020, partial [Gemmatimonadales bacterium]|nr:hypothetical protein [Gemmatimonadales bacterium]
LGRETPLPARGRRREGAPDGRRPPPRLLVSSLPGRRAAGARPPALEVRSLRGPRLLLSVAAAAVLVAGGERHVSAAAAFRVIVHPQVKGSEIPRPVLSAIFLKQALKWGDGRPVVPVDQSVQSSVRRVFSNEVLGQGVVEVQVYWQRRITAGLVPPPVKTSDEEVVAFVASTPGAIGYVSPGTPLANGVREVTVVD